MRLTISAIENKLIQIPIDVRSAVIAEIYQTAFACKTFFLCPLWTHQIHRHTKATKAPITRAVQRTSGLLVLPAAQCLDPQLLEPCGDLWMFRFHFVSPVRLLE